MIRKLWKLEIFFFEFKLYSKYIVRTIGKSNYRASFEIRVIETRLYLTLKLATCDTTMGGFTILSERCNRKIVPPYSYTPSGGTPVILRRFHSRYRVLGKTIPPKIVYRGGGVYKS